MKTILITGANSGIGKEAGLLAAEKGNNVFLICRDKEKGEVVVNEIKACTRNKNVELITLDLSGKNQ